MTTVLFADLVGFTTLAAWRDHEEVRELQSAYFDRVAQVVARYGGVVEKFIGDAVMAVWGVETAHEDDAERAVRAGLEIVDAVEELGAELSLPTLRIRIGIVTGEVSVTTAAAGQGMVTGDIVNVASRVQSIASPGEVWVDETTRLLTYAAITHRDVGAHLLKGKDEPTPLWAVTAVVANLGGAQRADGLEAPLAGRSRELRLVKELFHRTEETSHPSLLVISGEPGLGKTRLGWEFSKYADGLSTDVRWLEGRCVAYGDSVAYHALAEAVRGRLQGLSPLPEVDMETLVDLGLAHYVPDEAEHAWLRPRLRMLLGDTSTDFDSTDLFAAWTSFLVALSRGASALVLLIDDAQHADAGFLTFLEDALRSDGLPLYVVLLARPDLIERHPRLASNRHVSLMNLGPISSAVMESLLNGLVSGLSPEVRTALTRRADGVPLLAIETVRSLIDRDLVVPRGGQYVATQEQINMDQIGPPASLRALVASRLDALDVVERAVIDHASVLGQGFTREMLAALGHEGGSADVDHALAHLVRRQILTLDHSRHSVQHGRYGFTQEVVRDVAYGMLARRDRRLAHLRVADHFDDGSSELASLVARHLISAAEAVPSADDVADLRERALHLLVSASRRTLSLGIATGAVEHLTLARTLGVDDVAKARIDCLLARALGSERNFEAQARTAGDALEVLSNGGDPRDAGTAAAHLGFALLHSGRAEEAASLLQTHWEHMAVRTDADETLTLLGRYLLQALQASGRHDEVVAVALPTLGAAERTRDDLAILRILEALAITSRWLRLPVLTAMLVRALAQETTERNLESTDIQGLVIRAVESCWSDLARARRDIDHLDAHIERHRLTSRIGWMTMERLLIDLACGDWDALEVRHPEFADQVEPLERGAYVYVGLRLALERTGAALTDAAVEMAEQAVTGTATTGELLVRASVASESGDVESAVEFATQSIASALAQQNTEALILLPECVEILLAHHEVPGALQALRHLDEVLPRHDQDHTVDLPLRAHRAQVGAALALIDGSASAVHEGLAREAASAYEAWGATRWSRRFKAWLAPVEHPVI